MYGSAYFLCLYNESVNYLLIFARTDYISDSGQTNPIRLIVDGAPSPTNEGTVEMYYKGIWATICYENWDFTDAEVACRMLGFRTAIQVHK